LIAGVRAHQNGDLYNDAYAAQMAGQHGMALAKRFCERSPQLGGMVAARTWHLDAMLTNFIDAGGRDIVLLGVGWDMRPFRLNLPPGTRVYELDFPTTLAERARRLSELAIAEPDEVARYQVPIDLRTMALAPVLADYLQPNVPVFVAWEGMSMYFQEDEVRRILAGIMPVLSHPDSLLWVDLVDREAIENPEKFAEPVRNFMRGMQILGEPFTFGPESIQKFVESTGFEVLEVVPSDVCLREKRDPVYEIYKFCVARAANSSAPHPATHRKTRFDGKSSASPRGYARRANMNNGKREGSRRHSSANNGVPKQLVHEQP
jgi:methyltransferase (TIGR00027 family)